jgi:subtilisin family serine protease
VLSNSWGGGAFSQALLDEINRANTYNMLFVAAAGNRGSNNDTTPVYPANYAAPNVVSVAATDNKDQLASFSDYGATTVHLGAPGNNVYSTLANNNYGYLSGTSMATPHVSGAAVLVLSVCNNLQTSALKSTLLANVDADPALSGRTVTGGRLNVNKAVRNCSAITDNPVMTEAGAPGQTAFVGFDLSLGGGSMSPATTSNGYTYQKFKDRYNVKTTSYIETVFEVSGFTSDPGSGWLVSAAAEGVTYVGSRAATYSYNSGSARWSWNGPNAFSGWPTQTTCTIVHH